METRARFVLIGLFTLAVIAAGFGFVYWFQNLGSASDRTPYRIVFEGPVAGLRTGGSVTFNGIRVGEIVAVSVSDPRHVVATVSVDRSAPVRADTQVGLEFQGLTGIASVSLRGGAVDAPALAAGSDGVPTLRANGPILDVTEAVRSTLLKVDQVIIDNQQSLKAALASIEAFTKTLERNSERVDNVMIGMERLSGTKDKDGEILKAVQSIRELAENLDKRTEDIANHANRFMDAGVGLVSTGRRTLQDISRTVNNFDRNPSRVIWGASNSDAPAPLSPQQQQQQKQLPGPRRAK
jgi:phospholipid/cholesterol/gamma-HCH transport system substrate-binding protein